MEMASNGALKRAVAGGLGVTVLSTYAVGLEVQLGLLRPLHVRGFPVHRTWHVTWARDRLLSPAAAGFKVFLHSPEWRATLSVPLVPTDLVRCGRPGRDSFVRYTPHSISSYRSHNASGLKRSRP